MESEQNYRDLLRLAQTRRSVRRFLPRPLPHQTIDQLIEVARWAPSAGNRQAFRFLVVTGRPVIERMTEAVRRANARLATRFRADLADNMRDYVRHFEQFGGAPTVLVPIYRPGLDLLAAPGTTPGDDQPGTILGDDDPGARPSDADPGAPPRVLVDALSSVAAATMNLLLAAHALGLGACWMTGPLVAAAELRVELKVPEGWHIAALVPVGYPDETPAAPRRREIARLVRNVE